MKRRYEEVQSARLALETRLSQLGGFWRITMRQLYHDREAVTVLVLHKT